MLKEDYFKNRFFDIYEFSPIKYLRGTGFLSDSKNRIPIEWELNASITGDILFVLSSNEIILDISNDRHFKLWTVEGKSIDGYKIEAKNVFIYGNTIDDRNNSKENTYFCGFNTIDFRKKELDKIEYLIGHINNFYFYGRKFSVNVENSEFNFLQYEKDKKLMEMLKNGRISKAFFSVITTTFQKEEDIENTIKKIDNISCLISFFSMNMTVVPVFKFYRGNNLVGIKIRNLKLFPYIKSRSILDNFIIREGIKFGIEQCYESFINMEKQLDLKTIFNGLIAMMVQPYAELKIAILLVSYELLLSKYLLHKGLKKKEFKGLSIQSKLKKINSILKFIPKKMLKDDLRENVRNPLFHQGELPFSTSEEVYRIFITYWELLIQIILKIINYEGSYLEPDTNNVKTIFNK